mmetsp:Transcript_11641/g.35542  ORF Transcript_11641/g.35542 Transcript_11641/m.35542 type:complete len:161 (+) Transcript_11641:436-918(+)
MSRIPVDSLLNDEEGKGSSSQGSTQRSPRSSGKAGPSGEASSSRRSRVRWRPEEDEELRRLVTQHGEGNWDALASMFSTERTGRQLRARWKNNLDPSLARSPWSTEEDQRLLTGRESGQSWSLLARLFPGRCDNDLKNRYHQLVRSPKRGKRKRDVDSEK